MLDVLIVDHDEQTRRSWTAFLRESGLSVDSEPNVFAAIRRLEKGPGPVLVVVTEQQMASGPVGTALLETLLRRWPHTGRVLLTRLPGLERAALAVQALVLRKDDRPGDVRQAIIAEVQDAERRYQAAV